MAKLLATLAVLAGALLIPGAASAAGDASCATVNGKTQITYRAPSGASNNIVFRLSKDHACYQFINGDIGVVGPVTIESMSPTPSSCGGGSGYSSCRHGWMRNLTGRPPDASGGQALDGRDTSYKGSLYGGSLPVTLSGPTSVVKAVSDTNNNCPGNSPTNECLQFAAVLTILDTIPSDAGNMFRPPMYGTTASVSQTKRWSDLDWSGVARLSRSGVSGIPSMAQLKRRFEEVQLEAVNNYQGRKFHPEDNFQAEEYHGKIADTNAAALLRLTLDDIDFSNAEHKKAAAAVIQFGYDLAWMYQQGGYWWDHSNGRQAIAAFAADLFGDAGLIGAVRSGNGDREGAMTYISQTTGRALFGESCSESAYWDNQRDSSAGTKFCRDPYGYIDGPEVYSSCCLHGGLVAGTLAVRLTGTASTYNRDAALEYGARRYTFGSWAAPDPCKAASAGGGPNGQGGCITGSPSRGQDGLNGNHGANKDLITGNVGMFSSFVQSMKSRFYDCAIDGNCSSQTQGNDSGNSGGSDDPVEDLVPNPPPSVTVE